MWTWSKLIFKYVPWRKKSDQPCYIITFQKIW